MQIQNNFIFIGIAEEQLFIARAENRIDHSRHRREVVGSLAFSDEIGILLVLQLFNI